MALNVGIAWKDERVSSDSVVIVGGGPGGYEAALVAAALGANVDIVESDGMGGAAVLTDCVPSKALVATGGYLGRVGDGAARMGVRHHVEGAQTDDPVQDLVPRVDLGAVNDRIMAVAQAQSHDIRQGLERAGVTVHSGRGRLLDERTVGIVGARGEVGERLSADMILLATGASPRVLPTAQPDGARILTWQQVWALREVPRRLIVVGSGVTGAEFAQAYLHLGSEVVLVSSRDRVLPGEDPDAAEVIEDVFRRRGMEVLNRSRAESVERHGEEVEVRLVDGRTVTGSHALLAVGSVPQTQGLGLAEVGVATADSGHISVDRVSRTSVRGIYAAGDCTGVLPLASVAATQGRIAVAHALGDTVHPLSIQGISANIFTDPEIATVGITAADADADADNVRSVMMPLATNARAKMDNIGEGFVKLFARSGSNAVIGGVVVAPRASELIFPIALAVQQQLTVDQMAGTITVYPSLSGSLAEAARRLHAVDG
ncbi:putative oxidoreductase [Kineosphaera limosa NBRC 100340]|uniref:Putative oxidoreductase n=1 Tax=Kineosphaera limosa NBRC 100340 TaxID=1184609 RepID=K6WXE1_9MICO|nr:putative oxidoreductase [Kineosphaera limosa NBRC 100340]